MKQVMKSSRSIVAALFASLFVGCATTAVDLVDNGTVKTQIYNSENVKITGLKVRQYSDELLIHADVRPLAPVRFFHPGHLSFEMKDADGLTIWDLDVTRYSTDSQHHGVSKLKHASFWVRIPLIPPKGAVLVVAHHVSGAHDP